MLPWVDGSWTLTVLPDTQYYAMSHPDILDAQASWIEASRDSRGIAYVVHEGDVVHADERCQWKVAGRVLGRLRKAVPLALTTGNHDYDSMWTAAAYPPNLEKPREELTLDEVVRQHVRATLERCRWRVRGAGGAAERLGVKPTTLESRMKRLGIVRDA